MNFEKAFRQFQKKWRQGKYKSQVQKGCVGVAAVCAVVLIAYFMQGRQEEQAIEALRQIRNDASEETSNPDMVLGDQQILAQYQELFMQNPDLIGWLTIDGTSIDYPVMWTLEDPEYYSHRGFDKEDSNNGLLFMDELSSVDEFGGNVIIYGHNMKNGSMFADLLNYESESYWDSHKTIQFDTLTESRVYEIAAVVKSNDVEELPFEFTTARDDGAEDVIENMESASLYDTGVDMAYGDDFLTLATCDYSVDDGRLVVMAKRIQ